MTFIKVIGALPFLNDVQTSIETDKFNSKVISLPTLV